MLESRVREFFGVLAPLDPAELLLVAYSGGPDSTCLLCLLHKMHPRTAAVYINHNLRDQESLKEEEFVRTFCSERRITLFVERMHWRKRPSNLEETARKRRYRHLLHAARVHDCTKVALAHHRDDVAETLLLRLLRGSGPLGLAGPAAKRGIFLRPLLQCSREEILAYLQEHNLPYFTDSSNADKRFMRNKIRLDLLPLLEAYNPRVREALTRTALHATEQAGLVQELLRPYEGFVHAMGRSWKIDKKDLMSFTPAVRKQVLLLALKKADPSLRPDSTVVERLEQACAAQENLELPGFLMVESSTDAVIFTVKRGPVGYYEADIPASGTYRFLPGESDIIVSVQESIAFDQNPEVAFLDAEKASFPLYMRNWKKGDSFRPLGMNGSRKLSDFWIDNKVPQAERKRIPLIFKDDDLIWVAGRRIHHDYRITPETRRVLKIEWKKHV